VRMEGVPILKEVSRNTHFYSWFHIATIANSYKWAVSSLNSMRSEPLKGEPERPKVGIFFFFEMLDFIGRVKGGYLTRKRA